PVACGLSHTVRVVRSAWEVVQSCMPGKWRFGAPGYRCRSTIGPAGRSTTLGNHRTCETTGCQEMRRFDAPRRRYQGVYNKRARANRPTALTGCPLPARARLVQKREVA